MLVYCNVCNCEIFYKDNNFKRIKNKEYFLCRSCSCKKENKNNKLIKKCSLCDKEVFYNNEASYKRAILKNSLCLSCSCKKENKNKNFIRNCPQCNKEIFYNNEDYYNNAKEKNIFCNSCYQIENNKKMKKNFKRNCPQCNREMLYFKEKTYTSAIKNNKKCCWCNIKNNSEIKKIFKRNCPQCNKEIFHRTENLCINSEKDKKLCRSCVNVNSFTSEKRKRFSDRMKMNNPIKMGGLFRLWEEKYGKEKMEELKIKYLKNYIGKPYIYYLDVWKKKYGEEEAIKMNNIRSEKMSISRINYICNNQKSFGFGRGWSGWYKGFHFRSRNELYYLIYLIKNNINFVTAEKHKYKIEYIYKGVKKNYLPDFYLIDENKIIEIKPYNLLKDEKIKAKLHYAQKQYGENYIILTEKDIEKTSKKELLNFYYNEDLKLEDRYLEKFLKFCGIYKKGE